MNAALSTSRLDSLYSGFLSRPHQLFIDGKWTPAQSGETFAVLDPSTGREGGREGIEAYTEIKTVSIGL
jgi:acyl-CoA reductase-like NAD-dependent aldehyde dehydrogenase